MTTVSTQLWQMEDEMQELRALLADRGVHQELESVGRCCCGNDWICPHWMEESDETDLLDPLPWRTGPFGSGKRFAEQSIVGSWLFDPRPEYEQDRAKYGATHE